MSELTTPLRRRSDQAQVRHAELLEPIVLPALHYAVIPMTEYELYREWCVKVDQMEHAIERGRMEGKLDGYYKVLEHVRMSQVLSPIIPDRARLESILSGLIENLQADLNRLERPETAPDGGD